MPTLTNDEELRKSFEANLLDGDSFEKGHMISSKSVFVFFSNYLEDYKAQLRENIEGMKCAERKIHCFGNQEAETYNEKTLVNAVLRDVLFLLSDNKK